MQFIQYGRVTVSPVNTIPPSSFLKQPLLHPHPSPSLHHRGISGGVSFEGVSKEVTGRSIG